MLKPTLLLSALSLAVLTGAPTPTAAQQEAASKKAAPEARAVFARYVAVTNLEKRMKAVKSIHMLGKVSMKSMGIDGRFERWSMDGKEVTEMELGALGVSTTGYDGKVAWQKDGMMGPRLLDPLETLMNSLEVHYDDPLRPDRAYEKVESIGIENYQGKSCVRVRSIVRAPKGMNAKETLAARTLDELYDLESGLLLKKEQIFPSPMGNVPVVVTFEDYKRFDGILLPTRSVQKLPTAEVELTVAKVEFDVVKADRFALPKDIAKLYERQKAAGPK